MSRTTIGWALAAVAGLLLAAGLTLAVSELTSQHVGLYDESPDAGRELVVSTPARSATTTPARTPKRRRAPAKRPAPPRTTTAPPPVVTTTVAPPPATTTDDHGGSGGSGGSDDGSGRG